MCKVKNNGPMYYMIGNITVCLLMQDGIPVARGLGIGSRCDSFVPAEGRKYAADRAKEALGRKADCREILIDAVRNNAYDWFDSSLAVDLFGKYKGYYQPVLTATETRLLASHGSMIRPGKKVWHITTTWTDGPEMLDRIRDMRAIAGRPISIQSGN
jgi:hypothetical protein